MTNALADHLAQVIVDLVRHVQPDGIPGHRARRELEHELHRLTAMTTASWDVTKNAEDTLVSTGLAVAVGVVAAR